jgi:hypothetical protein
MKVACAAPCAKSLFLTTLLQIYRDFAQLALIEILSGLTPVIYN